MFRGITTVMPIFVRSVDKSTVADMLRATESVLSQQCSIAHELLIVDDGSNPRVESIPEMKSVLQRPDVRLLRLVRNQGLEFALNAGISQARYDLIARMDRDDYWRPGKLSKQLDALRSDPELTLVATSMRLVHPANPELDRDDRRGGDWYGVLSFFRDVGCPFPHASIVARRDVYYLLGGYPHDPHLIFFGDFALWGSWVRFFKVAVLPEVLFEYTISENQVSSQYLERMRRASGMVHQKFLELGAHQSIPRSVMKIAEHLELSLFEASAVLCLAWRFYTDILVNREIYHAARTIFPDRSVSRFEDAPDLLADRFFYLHRGPYDQQRVQHLGCIHTVEHFRGLVPDTRRTSTAPSC